MLGTIVTLAVVLTGAALALLGMDWLLERRGIPSRISMRAMYPVLACAFVGGFAQLDGKSYCVWVFGLALVLTVAGPLLAAGLHDFRHRPR